MLDVDGFKEVISESTSKGNQLKFYNLADKTPNL